jgi:transmembrane sensor
VDGRLVSNSTSNDAVEAQAALWLVRLEGASEPDVQPKLQVWLDSDPSHAAAFERARLVWGGLGEVGLGEVARRRPAGAVAKAAGVAATLLAAFLFAWWVQLDPTYATKVGEQHIVRLDDGTSVTLNTNTRLVVDYRRGERRVRLDRGEAIFEVAHDAGRPFLVDAGRDTVRALGTSFVVRREASKLEVTLLSGRVQVTKDHPSATPMVLQPGDRLSLGGASARLDHPRLDQLTAWRQGDLVLDKTPLSSAIAEMNRYSDAKIELAGGAPADAQLSGVFKTGESRDFAQTVAALYGLKVIARPGRLVIAKPAS